MAILIKLVRHGESLANIGEEVPQKSGDHTVGLTALGHRQAREAGRVLGAGFLRNALLYCSPYRRTRETLDGILEGAGLEKGRATAGLKIYEDPRLREVEHGYYDYEAQQQQRNVHGWFYYRYEGGESPADCFDRTSGFLESMTRQMERKARHEVLVVSHGLTIRCFAMRFLHLSVEEFEELANPGNAEIVTIGPRDDLPHATHVSGRWAAQSFRRRCGEV